MEAQRYLWEGWCSLMLPDGWSFSDEDGVISIFDEKMGVGALQLSFARRSMPHEPTTGEARALAINFASQKGWQLSEDLIQLTEISGCPASVFRYRDDVKQTSWEVWHILRTERVAFITYISDPDDFSTEERVRWAIVKSFKWE